MIRKYIVSGTKRRGGEYKILLTLFHPPSSPRHLPDSPFRASGSSLPILETLTEVESCGHHIEVKFRRFAPAYVVFGHHYILRREFHVHS